MPANNDWFEDGLPAVSQDSQNKDLQRDNELPGVDEVCSRVEDLWLRLARQGAIACTTLSDPVEGEQLVMFRRLGETSNSEAALLLELAACASSYRWSQEGRHISLISTLTWCADTLVIKMAGLEQMQRWPDGQAVQWQMQTLLQRLRALGGRS